MEMPDALERSQAPPETWCGRSWEGLAERRRDAFAHALALKEANHEDSGQIVSDFFAYFEATGRGLMRDEEGWIFKTLVPAPLVVLEALVDHIAISSLIQSLAAEWAAGCLDLRAVHELGQMLENHLLMEEEEVRPLTMRWPLVTLEG